MHLCNSPSAGHDPDQVCVSRTVRTFLETGYRGVKSPHCKTSRSQEIYVGRRGLGTRPDVGRVDPVVTEVTDQTHQPVVTGEWEVCETRVRH